MRPSMSSSPARFPISRPSPTWPARHLVAGGVLVAMKGVHPNEELAQLPAGIEVVATPALQVPGLDAARHLIIMRKRDR